MGDTWLSARASCNCQACLTWRRCGSLLDPCHFDPSYLAFAVQVLRHAASELSDQVELRGERAHRSLAGERGAAPVPPAGGGAAGSGREAVTKQESPQRREETANEEDTASGGERPSSHLGASPVDSRTAHSASKEKRREEKAAQKAEKKAKEKKPKRAKSPISYSPRRSRSRPRRKDPPRSPLSAPTYPSQPAPKRAVKEEPTSDAEESVRPPGTWTLTEASEVRSTGSSSRAPARSERPPEPPGPPPGWSGPISAGGIKRSRGVVRRERARDINLHGFDQERKRQRESRRDA